MGSCAANARFLRKADIPRNDPSGHLGFLRIALPYSDAFHPCQKMFGLALKVCAETWWGVKGNCPCSCRDWLRLVRRRQLGECNVWRDPEMSRFLPDLSPVVTANSERSVPSVARRRTPDRWRSAGARFSIWEYVRSVSSRVGIYISAQAMVLAVRVSIIAVWTLFPGP